MTGPVDQARSALHYADTAGQRRASTDAAGSSSGTTRRSGRRTRARRRGLGAVVLREQRGAPGRPGRETESGVRPFVVALGNLIAGFSDFQHLGMFNRLHLAHLVFGAEAV